MSAQEPKEQIDRNGATGRTSADHLTSFPVPSANLSLLKANAGIIHAQFKDYEYLKYGEMVAHRYIDIMQHDIGVTMPDMLIALCLSYSFAPHDYTLFQLSRFLSHSFKMWPSITQREIFSLIATFCVEHRYCSHHAVEGMHDIERYYNDLLETQFIVLVGSETDDGKASYIGISEHESRSVTLYRFGRR